MHDRLERVSTTPISTPTSSSRGSSQPPPKRPPKRRARDTWSYSRAAKDGEDYKNKHGHRYWYCKVSDCPYNGTTTLRNAREHLERSHGIVSADEPSDRNKLRKTTVENMFAMQKSRQKEEQWIKQLNVLKSTLNHNAIQQALVRLVVRHDLPQTITEWPEFIAFCLALNPAAEATIYRSHSSLRRRIAESYACHQNDLRRLLISARSKIHLCTDTWTSPQGHHKEFQAINAHFIDAGGMQRKALLSLPELPKGHAGAECAQQIVDALQFYQIAHRLGAVTSDNASAMDTMAVALSKRLNELGINWSARTNRLRCLGHILNLAVQAFLFSKDREAVDYANQLSRRSASPLAYIIGELSETEEQGWCTVPPLRKLRELTVALRNTKRYNDFERLAGRVIHMPNETRWNSWTTMIESALALKSKVNEFITERQDLWHLELGLDEWHVLEETYQFLLPFKEACKACEGEHVTLDQMLVSLDIIIAHFKASQSRHGNNSQLLASITTSWYAIDKYYNLTDDSPLYAAALLLHPSYRKQYLEDTWRKDWVQPAVEGVRALWKDEYAGFQVEECRSTSDDTVQARTTEPSFYQQQKELLHRRRQLKDEFELFIEQSDIDVADGAISWWLESSQQRTFPRLSRMAIDVLSAQAMSAESERVFSLTRRTISWDRTRLKCSTVEQLECQKSWIKDGVTSEYYVDDSDEDDNEIAGEDGLNTPTPTRTTPSVA